MTRITEFVNGDLRFPVTDSGPLDGPPVLLLHGWPQDRASWTTAAARLNDAGYRTYAPSLRGAAPTANPRARTAYRSSELRSDIRAMVTAIGQPVHLVGHDWGAALAWQVACADSSLIRTLTAVSVPHPIAFLRSFATSTQALHSWYMFAFQTPLVPELLLGSAGFMTAALTSTGQTPDHARRDVQRNQNRALRRGGLNWYRGAVLEPRAAGTPTPVPTLQVWSDGDTAVCRASIDATHRFASGPFRLEILRGVSHWIPDEAPAQLADLISDHIGSVGAGGA